MATANVDRLEKRISHSTQFDQKIHVSTREPKQPNNYLRFIAWYPQCGGPVVPVLKYFFVVGLSLLGVIVTIDAFLVNQPVSLAKSAASSSSIDVLREMAHHGEIDRISLAATGPLRPITPSPLSIAASDAVEQHLPIVPLESEKMDTPKATSVAFNAMARASSAELSKPVQSPKKKIVARAPIKRTVYALKNPNPRSVSAARQPRSHAIFVENLPHSPFGRFAAIQSW